MENNSHKKTKVILVHGTWSPNASWTQEGSALREAIKQDCPMCEESDLLHWPGANSVDGREEAAKILIKQIEQNTDQKHILIAHSHGGNVVLQALHDGIENKRIQDSVSGVVCLNTPFFTLMRKDTQHVIRSAIISLDIIFCLALLYPVFVLGDNLIFSLISLIIAMALSRLVYSQVSYKKIKIWTDERWLTYKKKFQQPRIISIPFLCFNSGADEAFTLLSVMDGIGNLPSILVNRIMIGYFAGFFAVLLLLHKIARYLDLSNLNWIKSIEGSVFSFVLVIFKLPDLHDFGLDVSLNLPFPNRLISAIFEIAGLGAFYAILFICAVAILTITFGALSRISTGNTGTWNAFILPLFVREHIALTPVQCEKVEFHWGSTADSDTPLHSSLYDDEKTIKHIVEWINKLERQTLRGECEPA